MLSPIEIRKQEFGRSVRGYDISEVRSFLESIADELTKLKESLNSKEIEVERLKSELRPLQSMEQTMKEAVFTTQETLRQTKEGSRKEADLIIKGAELESERIIQQAHEQSRSIRHELEVLKDRRNSFVRKLKHLIQSELELIDLLETPEESQEPNFHADFSSTQQPNR